MYCRYSVKIGMLLVLLLTVPFLVQGQSKRAAKGDIRVRKALEEVGLNAIVTSLGNYRLTFELDDKRGHWVFIGSRTEKFGALETRKIWATVARPKKPLSQAQANKLLMDNVPQKLGAFELSKVDKGGYKLVFAARVEADCRPSTLREAVRIVLHVADTKEKEMSGKDEF